MAFLDNSGDIILDAVLTDTGRMRLAKGDGSFRITKFALGDDEINYGLYDKTNASGSAYYDLKIMQTPVFEAFTNNIASLNSRLISISRNNLLYLPVLKINNIEKGGSNFAISKIVQSGYILAVDKDTEDGFIYQDGLEYDGTALSKAGILRGFSPTAGGEVVRIDQGIDNTSVPATLQLDPDLKETQYLIEVDNRFASIVDPNGQNAAVPSFIDDDDIATYYLSLGPDPAYISENTDQTVILAGSSNTSGQVIAGSRGTTLKFKLKAAVEVATSDYLFNQVGTNITNEFTVNGGASSATNVRSIVTTVRITGLTTGYAIDVPVVLIKKIS
jgi:hypothetical protein